MTISRLPYRLALAGVVIGLAWMLYWWLQYKYNFFHFPTVAETQGLRGSYSAPLLFFFLKKAMYVMCPALVVLQGVGVGMSDMVALIVWFVIAAANWPIYFTIGHLIVIAKDGRRR